MTDLVVWGGPVYEDTLKVIRWTRPTKVFAKSLEGMSNDAYGADLLRTGDPLGALLRDARVTEMPGSIGLAGFSAFHEWCSPFLEAVGDAVSCVHLCDSCFQGAGATKGKPGYVRYAKLAAAGKVRMTVTSNGNPREDIHYKGPAGSKYENTNFDLTSGSKCVSNFVREAFGGDLKESSIDLPPDLPFQPQAAYRKGEFRWLVYPDTTTKDPHGVHIKIGVPLIQMYMAPWLAGQRPMSSSVSTMVAVALGAAAGAYGARYVAKKAGW